MANKEKKVRYSEGYINGVLLAIKNGAISNKGKKDEALRFVMEVETEEGKSTDVDFFIRKYSGNGNTNKTYAKMKKLYSECRTVEDDGEGEIVNCLVKFDENKYVTKEGELVDRGTRVGGVFCTTQEDSKFPITKGSKGMIYCMLEGYEDVTDIDGNALELSVLVNNYAYYNEEEKEDKVNGFIMKIRTHNEEYAEYIKEELKVGDILYMEFDFIKSVAKAKKSRGIGKSVKNRVQIETYFELTNCSAPIMTLDDNDEYIKPVYDDLEEGEEEEFCYTVPSQEDFPFTSHYIELMHQAIDERIERLQEKVDDIKKEKGEEVEGEEVEVAEDEVPF